MVGEVDIDAVRGRLVEMRVGRCEEIRGDGIKECGGGYWEPANGLSGGVVGDRGDMGIWREG